MRALIAVVLLAVLAACSLSAGGSDGAGGSGGSAGNEPGPTVTGAPGSALAALAQITIKGRAPMTGYSRARFGPAWADTDHNGCDQRNDVLRRDLAQATFRSGTHGCVVLSGTLRDRYTGATIHFTKAAASKVQIDHVVALGDAWVTGADRWTATKREELATDPLNLLAVDGSENESKGDGDAATWLPPHKAYRCAYVARQVAVKFTYDAWMTSAEHAAIKNILEGCPNQKLPADEKIAPLGRSEGESLADTGSAGSNSDVTAAGSGGSSSGKPSSTASSTPTSGSAGARNQTGLTVDPGEFCSPVGANGTSNDGDPLVCAQEGSDARWKAA